jgi:hypothetical protein
MQCKYYTENGNHFKLANIYFEICELYETNNSIDNAMDFYKSAFNLYRTEMKLYSTTKYFNELAKNDYTTCADFLKKSIKSEFTRFILCKHIFDCLLCYLASHD